MGDADRPLLATLLAGTAGAEHVAVPSYCHPGRRLDGARGGPAPPWVRDHQPEQRPRSDGRSNYAAQVTHTRARGITVIAYVYTSYGGPQRHATVEADIDAYYAQYPDLDGIFIDEVSSDCALAPYYSRSMST